MIVRAGDCPAVVAQWQSTGGSSQVCWVQLLVTASARFFHFPLFSPHKFLHFQCEARCSGQHDEYFVLVMLPHIVNLVFVKIIYVQNHYKYINVHAYTHLHRSTSIHRAEFICWGEAGKFGKFNPLRFSTHAHTLGFLSLEAWSFCSTFLFSIEGCLDSAFVHFRDTCGKQ